MSKNILDTSKVFDAKIRIQMIASLSVDDFKNFFITQACATELIETFLKLFLI